jgi:hypothetical protein
VAEKAVPQISNLDASRSRAPTDAERERLILEDLKWAESRAVKAAHTWILARNYRPGKGTRLYKLTDFSLTLDDLRCEGALVLCEASRTWQRQGEFRAYAQAAITHHMDDLLWKELRRRRSPVRWDKRSTGEEDAESADLVWLDEQDEPTVATQDPRLYPEAHLLKKEWTQSLWDEIGQLDPPHWESIRQAFCCPHCVLTFLKHWLPRTVIEYFNSVMPFKPSISSPVLKREALKQLEMSLKVKHAVFADLRPAYAAANTGDDHALFNGGRWVGRLPGLANQERGT